MDFLLFYNAEPEAATIQDPADARTRQWDVVIDTAGQDRGHRRRRSAGAAFKLEARSMLVLRAHSEPEIEPDHSVAASLAVRTSQSEQSARARRSGRTSGGAGSRATAKPPS